MREKTKVMKVKFEERRKRAGGLLAKELQDLGVTFDENGEAVLTSV
jgi:hypothetical protein